MKEVPDVDDDYDDDVEVRHPPASLQGVSSRFGKIGVRPSGEDDDDDDEDDDDDDD